VVLFGFLVSAFTLPSRMRAALESELGDQQQRLVLMPFHVMAGLVVVTALLVGAFYCLDALHGERRDRSILFWKSLPVSDRTTVLAKAGIPLVVLPAIALVIVVAGQVVMLLVSTVALLPHGPSLALLWGRVPLLRMTLALVYALVAMALWHAPIYGWLLLVSGWARRLAILWAVLPFLAVCVFEGIAFRTYRFAQLLGHRLSGWFTQGFALEGPGAVPDDPLSHLTPGRLLATPGLWIGLVVAAVLLAAAVRLRRTRAPI
jgi:ABC-2 type transport system permease protein